MSVRSSIEWKSPPRSRFGSFLRVRYAIISYQHDVLVGELKAHKLVVFKRLVCKIVGQYTPFDGLFSDMLDVLLGQSHLPTVYSTG